MEISFFYRKQRQHAFSIESIFDNVVKQVYSSSAFKPVKKELPSIRNVFLNVFKAYRGQNEINHITGDIHYVSLGMKKRNTILTIHDCVFLTKYTKRDLKYWLFKFFWYKLPVLRAKTITVISEKTKRELITLTGVKAEKIKVIPNFYDPRYQYAPRIFNSTKPRILQIGTKENKNILNLAQALKGIHCELIIIGNLDSACESLLIENHINYKVYSNLSFEALKEQYEACDMVVFASTYEGFGLPILESWAVGRPLITSRISPMNEIAEDAACKVNPYNNLDIRRGILNVIENEEYRKTLVQNGRELVKDYSIEIITEKYKEIYQEIASQPVIENDVVKSLRKVAASFYSF
jgi:glycosyltransferase involved in cell wall biosynthesis